MRRTCVAVTGRRISHVVFTHYREAMKRLYRILLVAAAVLLVCAVGWYGIYHVAPYAIIMPSRPEPNAQVYALTPEALGLSYSHFSVDAGDSVAIDAWFLPAEGHSKGTVLVLHGIGAIKEHMIGAAAEFVHAGYNAVLFDLRAHGHSTGKYCTYGFYEKRDVSHIIDEVLSRFGAVGPFGVLGGSLGGAVALQAMESDSRIVCGVVESTFASLDDIVYEYQQQMLSIPFRFVAHEALAQACVLAKFSADSVRPEVSAAHIRQPVLLAHGEADERINISHGRRIFRALASPHKVWVSVPAATHNTLVEHGGDEYRQKRLKFFDQWMR